MITRPERRSQLVRPAAVVLAVVAGLGCVLLGVTTVLTPGTLVTRAVDRPVPAEAGAAPVMLRIPALGLVLDHLVGLGHISGRREQPGTALGVGWFTDGPVPGEPGVAVLSGHAGFGYTAGAFARLGKLEHGDTIIVGDEGGRESLFTVDKAELFPADAPDSELVAPEGTGPELRLITSDGAHDNAGLRSTRVAVSAIPAV